MASSLEGLYSITASVRASSVGGAVRLPTREVTLGQSQVLRGPSFFQIHALQSGAA
jgi:hypothetical protein